MLVSIHEIPKLAHLIGSCIDLAQLKISETYDKSFPLPRIVDGQRFYFWPEIVEWLEGQRN